MLNLSACCFISVSMETARSIPLPRATAPIAFLQCGGHVSNRSVAESAPAGVAEPVTAPVPTLGHGAGWV